MSKRTRKHVVRKTVLRLPDLDHAKTSVLNSLSSLRSRRNFEFVMEQFIDCRAELSALRREDIQIRQGHWAIVDLVGKGNHVRTVPIPSWVKNAIDRWLTAVSVTTGRVFRAASLHGTVWGKGISENVVWYVVRSCTLRLELDHLAPHYLRRTCAKLCHVNGGELEQIQFLLGHASVLTTERYLGCKQNLEEPVNDRFGCLFSGDVDSR